MSMLGGNDDTYLTNGSVVTDDALLELNQSRQSSADIGLFGGYNSSGLKYAGLFLDASDSNRWKLFTDLTSAPTNNVVPITTATQGTLQLAQLRSSSVASAPTNIDLVASAHATSRRTQIKHGDYWQTITDIAASGTQDYGIYNSNTSKYGLYFDINQNTGIGTSSLTTAVNQRSLTIDGSTGSNVYMQVNGSYIGGLVCSASGVGIVTTSGVASVLGAAATITSSGGHTTINPAGGYTVKNKIGSTDRFTVSGSGATLYGDLSATHDNGGVYSFVDSGVLETLTIDHAFGSGLISVKKEGTEKLQMNVAASSATVQAGSGCQLNMNSAGGSYSLSLTSAGALTVPQNANFTIGKGINLYSAASTTLGSYAIAAINASPYPIRFIGNNDGATTRPFQFGYYTNNDPGNTWNGKMRIDSYTGYVGIGTGVPSTKLQVAGAISSTSNADLPAGGGEIPYFVGGYSSPDTGRIIFGDGSGWKFHLSKRISSTTTDLFTFNDSGSMGIGTTNAGGGILHVHASTENGFICSTNSTSGSTVNDGSIMGSYGTDAYFWNREAGGLYLGTSNNERIRILSGGTILISNTTAPGGDPTGGGYLYVESGALKYRGSSGTITTIANA
jgi:hypothetical protein